MLKLKTIAILLISTLALSVFASCGTKTPSAEEIDTGDGTELSYDYDLTPFIKLGDYKGLIVTQTAVNITEDDIQTRVDSYLSDHSTTEQITEGTVKEGDTVNIDYVGYENGVAFDGGSYEGYSLTIGSGTFIAGFEDALIGHNIGETVTFDLTFADDYYNSDLAGHLVTFEVKLNFILVVTPAELNDQFLADNTDCTTIDEWRAMIKTELEEEAQSSNESEITNNLWTMVLDNAEVLAYPSGPVTYYENEYVTYFTSQATTYGYTDLESFVTEYLGATMDEFNSASESYAQDTVKEDLVFYSIVNAENITLTDLEYLEGANNYFDQYYYSVCDTVDDFIAQYGEYTIKKSLMWDKMMSLISDSAVITEETAAEESAVG